MLNVKEELKLAKSDFKNRGINGVDAELLLAHILGISRMDLHNSVVLDRVLSEQIDAEAVIEQFDLARQRRVSGEPVQYITGIAHFHNISLGVGPGVLIPRPETELIVESVLHHLEQQAGEVSVIDLGSGSGAIAISIALAAPHARVIAVENDEIALRHLRKNVETCDANVRIVAADISDALHGIKADIVVANPPYIADGTDLPLDVLNFEPHVALFGGPSGMEVPIAFMEAGIRLLKSGGLFLMEHGEEQAELVARNLEPHFENIKLHHDYNDRPRWTSAMRK